MWFYDFPREKLRARPDDPRVDRGGLLSPAHARVGDADAHFTAERKKGGDVCDHCTGRPGQRPHAGEECSLRKVQREIGSPHRTSSATGASEKRREIRGFFRLRARRTRAPVRAVTPWHSPTRGEPRAQRHGRGDRSLQVTAAVFPGRCVAFSEKQFDRTVVTSFLFEYLRPIQGRIKIWSTRTAPVGTGSLLG
jgi:hypothetical protein